MKPAVVINQVADWPEATVLAGVGDFFADVLPGPLVRKKLTGVVEVELTILPVAVVCLVQRFHVKLR